MLPASECQQAVAHEVERWTKELKNALAKRHDCHQNVGAYFWRNYVKLCARKLRFAKGMVTL